MNRLEWRHCNLNAQLVAQFFSFLVRSSFEPTLGLFFCFVCLE
jgi:hypothetical protein